MNLTAQEIYEKEFHVDLKGYAHSFITILTMAAIKATTPGCCNVSPQMAR